jgi:hypothetical protein
VTVALPLPHNAEGKWLSTLDMNVDPVNLKWRSILTVTVCLLFSKSNMLVTSTIDRWELCTAVTGGKNCAIVAGFESARRFRS